MKKFNIFLVGALSILLINPLNTNALTKQETIYTNLNYYGKTTKQVVNNHLSGLTKEDIEDQTVLSNITNLNGNEKFSTNGNTITWKSTGKDIYYQGKTDLDNPISMNITYYLNGKETKIKDLKGKEGTITIKVDMTNNSYNRTYGVHTPFVVTLGSLINNEDNSNISVTNGTVVSTGTKSMIVALAAPGLESDITGLDDINDITISYDTTNFSLNNMYFVATPKLLSKVDVQNLSKLDTLSSSINLIKENMDKIDSGAVELANGSNTLYAGTTTLNSGSKELLKGTKELSSGLEELEAGINQMDTGAISLSQGLNQMSAQVTALNTELQNTLTTEKLQQLQQLLNTDKQLYDVKNTYVNYSLANLTEEQISQMFPQDQVLTIITVKRTYETNPQLVELGYSNYLGLSEIMTLINKLDALNTLDQALQQASTGASTLSTGLTSAKAGSTELTEGANKLVEGTTTLSTGTESLESGAKTLNEGANTLSTGITQLNNQGITKLNDYANKIKTYTKKAKNLVNASKSYNGYSTNKADNTVFIYKVKSSK